VLRVPAERVKIVHAGCREMVAANTNRAGGAAGAQFVLVLLVAHSFIVAVHSAGECTCADGMRNMGFAVPAACIPPPPPPNPPPPNPPPPPPSPPPPPQQPTANLDTRSDVPVGYTCRGDASIRPWCSGGGRYGGVYSVGLAGMAAQCNSDATCTGFDYNDDAPPATEAGDSSIPLATYNSLIPYDRIPSRSRPLTTSSTNQPGIVAHVTS